MHFYNLEISPDPVVVPGTLYVTAELDVKSEVEAPTQVM